MVRFRVSARVRFRLRVWYRQKFRGRVMIIVR